MDAPATRTGSIPPPGVAASPVTGAGRASTTAPVATAPRGPSAPTTPSAKAGGPRVASLAKVWLSVVLTWTMYVVPPLVATLALGALVVSIWPRITLITIFLGFVVVGLWVQVLGAARIGRAGLTAADVRRLRISHATGVGGAFDTTDRVDAYARFADDGPVSDASSELPALQTLVTETARRYGLPEPRVTLGRGGYGVIVREKAEHVIVGTAFLTVASLDELRAELARQLAPFGAPRESLRALVAARAAAAGGAWRPPGITSRLDFVWWPASQAAGAAARAATGLAIELRAATAAAASEAGGADAARAMAARTLVLPELWREHLRERQRSWTGGGEAMAPHEGWARAWAARHAAGRLVAVDPDDVVDMPALCGWPVPCAGTAPVPSLAVPSALEQLAAGDAEAVLLRFDQLAASQYYEPVINEAFGAAGGYSADEDEPGGWAAAPIPVAEQLLQNPVGSPAAVAGVNPSVSLVPAPEFDLDLRSVPLAVDERATMPHVDLIVRQLDALDECMHRRDAAALATARAIDGVAQAPTVRTMAAGVRWLCGDPDGAAAIRSALATAPRGAGALADLVPALRSAGEHELAVQVAGAVADLEQMIVARFDLRKMWGRAPKLGQPDVPPAVKLALDEIAGLFEGRTRVYLAEVEIDSGPLRPYVLVVVKSFWTLRLRDATGDPGRLATLVWPATRLLETDAVEGRGRKRLRKTFAPLGRTS